MMPAFPDLPKRQYYRFAPEGTKYPLIGYISHWPSRRIVKVRVDLNKEQGSEYPLVVTSLDKTVNISGTSGLPNGFRIAALDVIKLYPTQRSAERAVLEQLHKEYAQARRELRQYQKAYKTALKRVEEWKAFKQILVPPTHFP